MRTFDVVAINHELVYNAHGDHDPKGLMYVLAEDEAVVRSGATIRCTLDGTAPTANRGMVFANGVRISMDRVLRAVAVDAAGNASPELTAAYDLP